VQTGRRSVVTIGAYDGVHIGHRQVIEAVRILAAERGFESVVVTFDRHPASVVRPESAPKLLCDLDQKLELLRATGVDRVVVVGFDEKRANEPAEEFVEEVLGEQLAAAVVVVGRDFHFGRGRGGDVALLEQMGAGLGFEVVPFDLVPDPLTGDIVSSTQIRRLIAAGKLREATRLLGRPHELRGPAVSVPPGRSASRRTPAMNGAFCTVVPVEILRPPPGVYPVAASLASGNGPEAPALVASRAVVPVDDSAPVEVTPFGPLEEPPPTVVEERAAGGRDRSVDWGAPFAGEAGDDAAGQDRIARVLFGEGAL
jgi:riboflavin kinase/FMN adenylyltransferase